MSSISLQSSDPFHVLDYFNLALDDVTTSYNVKKFQNAEIFLNVDKQQKIVDLLSDAASKELYCAELRYVFLSRIFGGAVAEKYANIMSVEKWNNAMATTKNMLASGKIHHLPFGVNDPVYTYTMCTTFLLKQYRYGAVVMPEKGDVFLDCGACFGETAIWAQQLGAAAVYSFEPDPRSYDICKKNFERFDNDEHRLFPIMMGVGDTPCQASLDLSTAMLGSSQVIAGADADRGVSVAVTTIDDWCLQNRVTPSFIKMDIEGYELKALEGARKTIETHKPKLAICLYHRPSDMWTIPDRIRRMVPEYEFYCKKSHPWFEFVLFAKIRAA